MRQRKNTSIDTNLTMDFCINIDRQQHRMWLYYWNCNRILVNSWNQRIRNCTSFHICHRSIQSCMCTGPFVDYKFRHSNNHTFLCNLCHKFHHRTAGHSDDLNKTTTTNLNRLMNASVIAKWWWFKPFHPTSQKHCPVSGLHFPCVQLHFCVQSPKNPSSHCFSHLWPNQKQRRKAKCIGSLRFKQKIRWPFELRELPW